MNFTISPTVVLQQLDDVLILLDTDSGRYFQLTGVGVSAWACMAEHGDAERVLVTLLGEYDVAPEELRDDLEVLWQALQAAGLILPAPAPATAS